MEAVDFMCIRIRTFDNRLVRVPNETLIKANIVNVTYFPQRRLDLWLTLPADCDFALLFETGARGDRGESPRPEGSGSRADPSIR